MDMRLKKTELLPDNFFFFFLLDHSCIPNAVKTFNGRDIIVTTIEEVDNFSGKLEKKHDVFKER